MGLYEAADLGDQDAGTVWPICGKWLEVPLAKLQIWKSRTQEQSGQSVENDYGTP